MNKITTSDEFFDLVRERLAEGKKKYGEAPTPETVCDYGREFAWEAMEELADAWVYLGWAVDQATVRDENVGKLYQTKTQLFQTIISLLGVFDEK